MSDEATKKLGRFMKAQYSGQAREAQVRLVNGHADHADDMAAEARAKALQAFAASAGSEAVTIGRVPTFDPRARSFLTAEAWATRAFPAPVRLLGDLVTKTTRTFLVGATGVGKSLIGVAMAAGMATGTGFLDWPCDRPVRVLYLDGEMPGELVRDRIRDAIRRTGRPDLMGNLIVYSLDAAEAFDKLTGLGIMPPLNTEAGRLFLLRLIEGFGGFDVVIFDNCMSLLAGDQKEEATWSDALPLVMQLTKMQIGQIWLDHAGHLEARQYGSSTKAWRFDAVGILTRLDDATTIPGETGFNLSFDTPGKARRRTPDNWHQFAPRTIRLADDQWTAGTGIAKPTARIKALTKEQLGWLTDIVDIMAHPANVEIVEPTPGAGVTTCVTRSVLRTELARRARFSVTDYEGKIGPLSDSDRATFKRTLSALRDNKKIYMLDQLIWLPNTSR